MIKIRLNPTIFNPGGKFYGIDQSRAILSLSTGKPEGYTGIANAPYGLESKSWRGSSHFLAVDATGVEMSDLSLEYHMTNSSSRNSYGQIIIDMLERGLIIVEKDGVPLTPAALNTFTA
jgi:hypothetical protein